MSSFRMPLSRRAALKLSGLALPALAGLPATVSPALADTWPSKSVHIVVPFAPGGSGDITARLVGKYMEDKTGQPFVIENKPGANG
ncbi:MAG: tripartite tricarboxylate transporter substrate binding protein, partial [Proteobacteria bacterium]|nr:tripartite tricarboxylate transporter substrate binding protein [Pseudomonadota bacterium]